MNQDQVKELLLQVCDTKKPFTVIFTGKSSKKVNGLYKPETQEILLHNKNFTTDKLLMYTALHEYAHHVHFSSPNPPGKVAHDKRFWSTFNWVLDEAGAKGVYTRTLGSEVVEKQVEAVKTLLAQHARLEAQIGEELNALVGLCTEFNVRFEEVMDRHLKIKRNTAKRMMNAAKNYELFEDFVGEGQVVNSDMLAIAATVAGGSKDREPIMLAAEALGSGSSLFAMTKPADPLTPEEAAEKQVLKLKNEHLRLERTINKLENDLERVDVKLTELQAEMSRDVALV